MRRIAIAVAALLLIAAAAGAQEETRDALALYRDGLYAEAVEVCLAELEERGEDQLKRRMDSYSVLGWSLLRLGEYDRALEYARRARQEVRYDSRIVEIEAEALFYTGENLESLARFEEYVSLNPTGDRIDVTYYFMGEIFLRLGEYLHADVAFSTALHHAPQSARWWARLAYTREQIPDPDGAETAYRRALELMPSLEEARAGLERVRGA